MTGKDYLNDRVKVNTSDLFKRMLGILEDIKHEHDRQFAVLYSSFIGIKSSEPCLAPFVGFPLQRGEYTVGGSLTYLRETSFSTNPTLCLNS